jgi:hypothetical protein
MTAIFLPEVIFIRDSLDDLKIEISDYKTALKKIQELYWILYQGARKYII